MLNHAGTAMGLDKSDSERIELRRKLLADLTELARRPNVEEPPSPDLPVEERRDVLNAASDIIDAVAPELFEERRRELEEMEKRQRRGWKFWRRER